MSHTFVFPDPQTGAEYRIHHNGDYSGDATVVIDLTGCSGLGPDAVKTHTFWVPCRMLVAFAGEAVKDKIAGLIEELEL